MEGKRYFLGFDFSTQQIKAVATDEALKVAFESSIKFDTDLPEFGTNGGAHIHEDKVTVTAPTVMWVKGLDMLLDKMKAAGFDFSKVIALSGDGQQHGSVYWKTGARQLLKNLNSNKSLFDQLKKCFSIEDSPIWMDSSTTKQCHMLEEACGGPEELARLTGSRAFERYTGSQIMKIYQTNRLAYDNTERISLVSSFACSLFWGDYAPIDFSDGSGMNLLDIHRKVWSSRCVAACGGTVLAQKLGEPAPSNTVVGRISQYMVERYGFSSDCRVVVFTGDNPASLAGLAPQEGDVILPMGASVSCGQSSCLLLQSLTQISLGSSDTVFLWLPSAYPGLYGHIFVNPLDPNAYMGLVCFKNGSLTRERVMEDCAGSWENFNRMVEGTCPGNSGHVGIYFDQTEIQPVVMGTFRYGQNDELLVDNFPPVVEARAVLESQFLARLLYSKYCGLQIGPLTRLIATGGASENRAILQVIADIFNANVYTCTTTNSAALGGCYRAKHALMSPNTPFSEVVQHINDKAIMATWTPGVEKVYIPMLARYEKIESYIATHLAGQNNR